MAANIFGRKDKKAGKRETRFAGTWYESDPKKLGAELQAYLDDADKVIDEDQPGVSDKERENSALYAIIAPHAGYMFSGSTAAVSYEFARKFSPKRIFLMGPSHYVGFQGVALSPDSVFETPLGDLTLDRNAIDDLLQYPMFEESREVHQREHSLELQLSFIRKAFGEVQLVPLIVGMLPDASEVRLIGQIIRRYLRDDDLVVVSSDFTHYGPRYDYVPFKSEDAPEKVKALDLEAFECLKDADLERFMEFHDRTQCTICGFYPSAVLLSMLPAGSEGHLLQYRTSRDTAGEDSQNSVSYLAIAFTGSDGATSWQPDNSMSKEELLSENDKANLLKLARAVLEKFVRERKILKPEDVGIEVTPAMKRPLGVFVTLFKKDTRPRIGVPERLRKDGTPSERDLRGCIGYIWPIKPLVEAVIDNVIGSCSKDPRFIEVKTSELADLELEISVLTPLRRVDSEQEIEVGKHGVVLYCKGRQSVFLPHVAEEFGWTRDEMLSQLCSKAGLSSQEWRNGAHYDIFESIMFEEESGS
jgi:AmmeMemoRadiSam system protein B/uncharacterized protein (TIGR00296 family)